MQPTFAGMFNALTVARDAMREVVKEFSLFAFVDRWEFDEVLHMNSGLARAAQNLLDLMLTETHVDSDALANVRNLATFFQATERLLSKMLDTAISRAG